VKRPVFWNLGQILVDLNLAHTPFFCNSADLVTGEQLRKSHEREKLENTALLISANIFLLEKLSS
jgi:hypothetical protein